MAIGSFLLEQPHSDLPSIQGFEIENLNLKMYKLRLYSELIENINLFSEELHKLRICELMKAIEPKIFDKTSERLHDRF